MKTPFNPALTQRVRELILDKGRMPLASLDPRFDELGASPEMSAVLARVAPIAEALFLAMGADGVCTLDERTALRGALRTITDDALSKPAIAALVASFDAALEVEGFDGRLSRVAAQLAGDRAGSLVTLELAAALMTADGYVAPEERDALVNLAEQTGNDPDGALALLG